MKTHISGPTGDSKSIRASAGPDQRGEAAAWPACGDFDIAIAQDGTWFYKNSPIGRKALVRLFSTVLQRDKEGQYWLVTPVERCRVAVEDAPFTAVELSVTGSGEGQVLWFRTNVDDWVEAGPKNPIRVALGTDSQTPRPYILVRDGLEALIRRSVYYELVELGVERARDDTTELGVWSHKAFFSLGCLD